MSTKSLPGWLGWYHCDPSYCLYVVVSVTFRHVSLLLREVHAADKPRNVYEALSHETEALHISTEASPRGGILETQVPRPRCIPGKKLMSNELSLFVPYKKSWGGGRSTANRSYLLWHYVLFFSRPGSGGWPHHGRSILSPFISVLCHSDWLFYGNPVHALVLSIQPMRGLPRLRAPSIVPCILSFWRQLPFFSLCDHSMLASLLWLCLTVSLFTPAFLRTHSFVFFAVHETPQNLFQYFYLKGVKTCFFILSECPAFTAYVATGHTSAFISRIFIEIGMLW